MFWKGGLTAGALAVIAFVVAQMTALTEDSQAPAWVAAASPIVLHLLGLAKNAIKHWND
jgi:hypothetical protein